MTIQELGNLGEFISSIAVLVSLIYLARQVKHNSDQIGENVKALKRGEMNETMRSYSAQRARVMSDATLAEVLVRSRKDPASLDDVDQERLRAFLNEMMWINYQIWTRVQEGIMERHYWENGEKPMLRMMLGNPFVQQMWDNQKSFFLPGYVEEIEAETTPT